MDVKNDKLSFLNYSKISDTIMFFNTDVTMKICINLSWKSKTHGNISHFHNEYSFYSDNIGDETSVIKRTILPYFSIEDKNNKGIGNNINIFPQDIMFLRYLLDKSVMPWFTGKSRIWSIKDGKMFITGKWNLAEFPLSDYKYLAFMPVVITYEDGEGIYKEGIRMFMNSKDNFIDININKFMEFYYYIFNTDLYVAGSTMANYVKTLPYGENNFKINDDNGNSSSNGNNEYSGYREYHAYNKTSQNNFFNKLK